MNIHLTWPVSFWRAWTDVQPRVCSREDYGQDDFLFVWEFRKKNHFQEDSPQNWEENSSLLAESLRKKKKKGLMLSGVTRSKWNCYSEGQHCSYSAGNICEHLYAMSAFQCNMWSKWESLLCECLVCLFFFFQYINKVVWRFKYIRDIKKVPSSSRLKFCDCSVNI